MLRFARNGVLLCTLVVALVSSPLVGQTIRVLCYDGFQITASEIALRFEEETGTAVEFYPWLSGPIGCSEPNPYGLADSIGADVIALDASASPRFLSQANQWSGQTSMQLGGIDLRPDDLLAQGISIARDPYGTGVAGVLILDTELVLVSPVYPYATSLSAEFISRVGKEMAESASDLEASRALLVYLMRQEQLGGLDELTDGEEVRIQGITYLLEAAIKLQQLGETFVIDPVQGITSESLEAQMATLRQLELTRDQIDQMTLTSLFEASPIFALATHALQAGGGQAQSVLEDVKAQLLEVKDMVELLLGLVNDLARRIETDPDTKSKIGEMVGAANEIIGGASGAALMTATSKLKRLFSEVLGSEDYKVVRFTLRIKDGKLHIRIKVEEDLSWLAELFSDADFYTLKVDKNGRDLLFDWRENVDFAD